MAVPYPYFQWKTKEENIRTHKALEIIPNDISKMVEFGK